MSYGKYECQDLFIFEQTGRKKDGTIVGKMVPTGKIPTFWDQIVYNHIPFEKEFFDPEYVPPKKKKRA